MKYVLILAAFMLLAYAGFETIRIFRLVKISARLVAQNTPFSKETGGQSLLVLGDSTAAGVGSVPEGTVAARISDVLDMSVENHARSGAKVADILTQLSSAQREKYDLTLIQIGANDIIRFTNLGDLQDSLSRALEEVRAHSNRVVVLTAGKVGEAPFFPRMLGWIWTMRAAQVREVFIAETEKHGVLYIDLFSAPDPFSEDPGTYYAPDGLHLRADGYQYWYTETLRAMQARWPDIVRQ